jgi:hypothetical protein
VICCDVRVFVNARRLVAAVAFAACGVAVGTLPAEAGTQADAKRASAVFTGTVTDVSRTPERREQPVIATYDVLVDRVYKGSVGTETVQVTSRRTSKTCRRLVLGPERAYVFFVGADGSALTADTCSGTAGATGRLVAKVQRMLGDGRLPVPARPEQAVFTRVADAEPATLTRMAAPGVALVLVGLLGLIVVGRLGSRGA